MKAYYICYHNDEDGLASAAVIYEYLKRINKKNKKNILYHFHKINYTINLKEIIPADIHEGDELYFVDYSFSNSNNLDFVFELSNKNVLVTWIDHHATSLEIINTMGIDKLNTYKNFQYFINTNYCAAYLCYIYAYFSLQKAYSYGSIKYLIEGIDGKTASYMPKYIPLYIKYVNSWDTWKFDMENTAEFISGCRSIQHRTPKNVFGSMFKFDSRITDELFLEYKDNNTKLDTYMQSYINDTVSNGKIIKEYENSINGDLCSEYGFEFKIIDLILQKEYNCFALNKRGNSTIFGNKFDKYDIVVPFQFNGDQFVYSLYTNKEDVDCADLAKKLAWFNKLSGGGHVKAAGFQTYDLLIEKNCTIYISKKLFRKDAYNIVSSKYDIL